MVAITALGFIVLFALCSDSTVPATAAAVQQFFTAVLPSVFPFYVAATVLRQTRFCDVLSKITEKPVKALFGVAGAGAFPIITGMICGYPAGAAMSVELYLDGKLSSEDVVRLSAFVNNTGPLFIIGAVGAGMLGSAKLGAMLWGIHIVSALLSGFVLCLVRSFLHTAPEGFNYRGPRSLRVTACDKKKFGQLLSESMTTSMYTMIPVAAAIIFFAAFNAVLASIGAYAALSDFLADFVPTKITESILKGLVEITGGISSAAASDENIKIILPVISLLAGFGGISVHFQVVGIYAKENIPCSNFILGKCFHGVTAFFLTLMSQ